MNLFYKRSANVLLSICRMYFNKASSYCLLEQFISIRKLPPLFPVTLKFEFSTNPKVFTHVFSFLLYFNVFIHVFYLYVSFTLFKVYLKIKTKGKNIIFFFFFQAFLFFLVFFNYFTKY